MLLQNEREGKMRRACLELLGKLLGKLQWAGCLELLGKLQQGLAADVDLAWPACAGCNVTHLHTKRYACQKRWIVLPLVHTSSCMCGVHVRRHVPGVKVPEICMAEARPGL